MSFQLRLNYHSHSAKIQPGPLDVYIQYVNDSSRDNGFVRQEWLNMNFRMNAEGWLRWEVALPTFPQLRYVRSRSEN